MVRYSKQVKEKARGLVAGGMSPKEAAHELGVNYYTLWEWVSKARPRRQEARRARVTEESHKEKRRAYHRNYARQKMAQEPYFARRMSLTCLTGQAIRSRWKKRDGKAADLLGCLPSWLAGRWDEVYGARWEERYLICHRRPCSSFDLAVAAHQKVCYNWRNLTLLPKKEGYTRDVEWSAEVEKLWALSMRSLGYDGELYLVFPGFAQLAFPGLEQGGATMDGNSKEIHA
jgi:transposase